MPVLTLHLFTIISEFMTYFLICRRYLDPIRDLSH